jgi:hypothetical protein
MSGTRSRLDNTVHDYHNGGLLGTGANLAYSALSIAPRKCLERPGFVPECTYGLS